MSRLIDLYQAGQSAWLDYIDRNLLINGGLKILVNAGLRGVTTNPAIFLKAITTGREYDAAIRDLLQAYPAIDAATLYEWLVIQDVQMAADILQPVYASSDGADGYVSVEVSPHLAHNTKGTLEAARHLWKSIGRGNVMLKVPATREGLPAIEQLIAEGIPVNATLLFSVARYEEVWRAYSRGVSRNSAPGKVASVASFFVSRIDGKVDPLLVQIGTPKALGLRGKIAIANAKMAYQRFQKLLAEPPFSEQRSRGARVQRVLWGSTSTKDPGYSDVRYVESLIGADTVNTIPPATLDAFQDHGVVQPALQEDGDEARRTLAGLEALGINFDTLLQELEKEGIAAFVDAHDRLLVELKEKCFAVAKHFADG
jgi:transaldolase